MGILLEGNFLGFLVSQFVFWKQGAEPMVFPFLEDRTVDYGLWSLVVEDGWGEEPEKSNSSLGDWLVSAQGWGFFDVGFLLFQTLSFPAGSWLARPCCHWEPVDAQCFLEQSAERCLLWI